jgi:uncharacterized protein YPO0396
MHDTQRETLDADIVRVTGDNDLDVPAEDPSGGPAPPSIIGFRLDELQIQNFGTYDGPPSAIRFDRGGAIFTGRNGVGKTTAIDAFRMLIAQEPSFNDATIPESKKRDRVDAQPWRETAHGHDRVAGKLDVRKDSEFAGHVRHVLDSRYDHACFAAADEGFRRAPRALTKAGQSKDGDRHVKDDRKHIDDRASFTLGWDTAERVAALARDMQRLKQELRTTAETKGQLGAHRDHLMLQANNMLQLADSLGEFQSVDIAALSARSVSARSGLKGRPHRIQTTSPLRRRSTRPAPRSAMPAPGHAI